MCCGDHVAVSRGVLWNLTWSVLEQRDAPPVLRGAEGSQESGAA